MMGNLVRHMINFKYLMIKYMFLVFLKFLKYKTEVSNQLLGFSGSSVSVLVILYSPKKHYY